LQELQHLTSHNQLFIAIKGLDRDGRSLMRNDAAARRISDVVDNNSEKVETSAYATADFRTIGPDAPRKHQAINATQYGR
jgi:hypothetical protein